jgi:hypothetical protein
VVFTGSRRDARRHVRRPSRVWARPSLLPSQGPPFPPYLNPVPPQTSSKLALACRVRRVSRVCRETTGPAVCLRSRVAAASPRGQRLPVASRRAPAAVPAAEGPTTAATTGGTRLTSATDAPAAAARRRPTTTAAAGYAPLFFFHSAAHSIRHISANELIVCDASAGAAREGARARP